MSREKQYLIPTEVANLLMVSAVAVRKWAQSGELKALTTPGGHRRFLMRDVQEFAKKRGINLLSPKQTEGRKLMAAFQKEYSLDRTWQVRCFLNSDTSMANKT